jgi:PEP-CTERM motif
MKKTMNSILRSGYYAAVAGFSGLSALAQISSINSIAIQPRVFNDVPGATLAVVSNYPSLVVFSEQGVSAASGFANRDVWQFSNNGGASAYQFNNNDFFSASMTLTLAGSPTSPRKEAGFLFNTAGGDGQFIVDTDAHEVVAFGGPLPFYAFPSTFNSGDTITLGIQYFLDGNGKRAVIYSADGVQSPPQEFSNLEQGIIDNSTFGGYMQVQNSPTDPANYGLAVFQNISIGAVPEPSTLALLGVGLSLLMVRRYGNATPNSKTR